ncbi:MAG: hypothetical protein MI747_24250 [Desulfobacterales bacterium]|nr:hypothetical protein [Desulfobacterales bacterium]
MKDQLTASAKSLVPPSPDTIAIFERRLGELISLCSRRLEERGDMETFIGPGKADMAWNNNGNFARFMISMFKAFQPAVLVESVIWVFRTYRAHGFKPRYWDVNIKIWIQVLEENLPREAFDQVAPFYRWLADHVPAFTRLTDTAVHPGGKKGSNE